MVKESSLQGLIFSSLVFRRFGKCGPTMIPAMMNPNTDPKPRCSNRMTHIAVAPRINTKLIRIDDSSTIVASDYLAGGRRHEKDPDPHEITGCHGI